VTHRQSGLPPSEVFNEHGCQTASCTVICGGFGAPERLAALGDVAVDPGVGDAQ
jgi:hypothetical protein